MKINEIIAEVVGNLDESSLVSFLEKIIYTIYPKFINNLVTMMFQVIEH